MCANSAELDGTQQHWDEEQAFKSPTETHSSILTRTQPQFLSKTAKPLFVGSIPTAAFNLFNNLGQS